MIEALNPLIYSVDFNTRNELPLTCELSKMFITLFVFQHTFTTYECLTKYKMCKLCKGIYVDFQTKSLLLLTVWVFETLHKMSKQLFSYF